MFKHGFRLTITPAFLQGLLFLSSRRLRSRYFSGVVIILWILLLMWLFVNYPFMAGFWGSF